MMYKRGAGVERIDVDVHLPSTDEAVLLREVVVELEVHEHLTAGRRCTSRAFRLASFS